MKEGDIIGRIVVMEFNDCNNTEQALFNEVMEIFNKVMYVRSRKGSFLNAT